MLYPLCRHIKTNGTQCSSPALTNQTHCFYHTRLHQRHRNATKSIKPVVESGTVSRIELGLLDDAESIQIAISQIINALAAGQLESNLAKILLYGMQMASANLARMPIHASPRKVIRSIESTPEGEDLAKDPAFYNDYHPAE